MGDHGDHRDDALHQDNRQLVARRCLAEPDRVVRGFEQIRIWAGVQVDESQRIYLVIADCAEVKVDFSEVLSLLVDELNRSKRHQIELGNQARQTHLDVPRHPHFV